MVFVGDEKQFCRLVQKGLNNPDYCDVVIVADDGSRFHGSSYLLRCGSDVFHKMFSNEMREKISGRVHIRDADSTSIRELMHFLHCGGCDVDSEKLLPLMSLAHRYQVNSLVAMCKEFQRKQFTIDTNNCCTILEQTYQFLEAPIGLQIMCQDIILQNMIELQQDNSLAEKFVKLSFSIVKEIAKASLPRMFLLDPFPANYITMSAALLEWLDHDESTREEKAVELLTFLEFESLGLEGIARIMDRPHPKKNWVRSYPALEQKLLNAISLAGRKPIKHIQSKALNCDQGRWTFVCRGGCNKKHKGATVVTTFELKQPVSLYIYVSTHGHTGCAVYATCNKNTKHLLVAAGGGGNEDAKFYGVQQDSGMDEKPGRPNTSRPSSARWKCCSLWLGNERKLDVSTCHGTVHSAGASYIHPIGEEIIQTWSAGPQSSVTIYSRTTSSQSLTVENTECSTV